MFIPVLTRIVEQGVEEGSFDTADPEGVADMFLQLANATHGFVARAIAAEGADRVKEAIGALERRMRLYEIALNAVLRIPDGSVRLYGPGDMRALMMARRQADTGEHPLDKAPHAR